MNDGYLLAHKSEDGREQLIEEHLKNVAELAKGYGEEFQKGHLAYIGGMLHDIGKCSEQFQRRIRGNGKKCDHSTAGLHELNIMDRKTNMSLDYILGYSIAGHHSGLMNGGNSSDTEEEKSLIGRIKKGSISEILGNYSQYKQFINIPELLINHKKIMNELMLNCTPQTIGMSYSFLIRMLYSCLVDADYLDTEKFMCKYERESFDAKQYTVLYDKLITYKLFFQRNDCKNKKGRGIVRLY